MNDEKMFYNAVSIALDGNPSSVRALKEKCGNLFGGWRMAYESLRGYDKFIAEDRPIPDVEKEWKALEASGVRLIFFDEPEYPALLREISDPPIGIYVRGTIPASKTFSIVGTRRATSEGKSTTRKFARAIAEAGFTIVSGLALGIDAAAHEGCLEANGTTIAILAGGLNDIYPAQNAGLGKRILETGGAFISEYPLGSPPYKDRFLERNQIVSGLSKGVLVVECPQNSGSLATARFALEQNRDVFIVPGPISHPNFFGSHQLIRQGAELVTRPEEILEAYGIDVKEHVLQQIESDNNEENYILKALRDLSAPADVDKIISLTKLEPRVANRAITFLLIKGLVKETNMGYIIE